MHVEKQKIIFGLEEVILLPEFMQPFTIEVNRTEFSYCLENPSYEIREPYTIPSSFVQNSALYVDTCNLEEKRYADESDEGNPTTW